MRAEALTQAMGMQDVPYRGRIQLVVAQGSVPPHPPEEGASPRIPAAACHAPTAAMASYLGVVARMMGIS